MKKITAQANPNIAFIKYWGNQDDRLRIPSNGSISMNLKGLTTTTTVSFSNSKKEDTVVIDGMVAEPTAKQRVTNHLNLIRNMAKIDLGAEVISTNNFPMGSGIASSASAFAALSLAGSKAAGLTLNSIELSQLARQGSGSACRSIPPGIVEWYAGSTTEESFSEQLVAADYWDIIDCVVIMSEKHKNIGSSDGHRVAHTSPLQLLRVSDARRRLDVCRKAILDRDFESFAEIVEQDSNLMHSVMNTSNPSLVYWNDVSITVMATVMDLRAKGFNACYTIDAGANVHVLTLEQDLNSVMNTLMDIPGIIRILTASIGEGTHVIENIPNS